MLLLAHVVIAISSILVATLLHIKPSSALFKTNYSLIAGTLLTGSVLILHGAPILSTCASGLMYLAVVMAITIFASKRFSANKVAL